MVWKLKCHMQHDSIGNRAKVGDPATGTAGDFGTNFKWHLKFAPIV